MNRHGRMTVDESEERPRLGPNDTVVFMETEVHRVDPLTIQGKIMMTAMGGLFVLAVGLGSYVVWDLFQ